MIDETIPPPHPGVIRRLAAMVYDSMLLFGVLFIATLIPALIISPDSAAQIQNNDTLRDAVPTLHGIGFRFYLMMVIITFFCWFWHRNGQTLGMQAWRLRIENVDGSNISLKQCLIRILTATLSLGLLGMGYWWIWISPQHRSWHDLASHSRVVLLPKNK